MRLTSTFKKPFLLAGYIAALFFLIFDRSIYMLIGIIIAHVIIGLLERLFFDEPKEHDYTRQLDKTHRD